MSSSLSAFRGLKPNTFPIIDAVRFAIEPGSKRSNSYAIYAKYSFGLLGVGSTL